MEKEPRYQYLHNWLIHYNEYSDKFEATNRNTASHLFSNSENLIKSTSINTLIEIIEKTNGDTLLLTKLTK